MATIVGELFFHLIRPSCLALPRPLRLTKERPSARNRQPGAIQNPDEILRQANGIIRPAVKESEHEVYTQRLDCVVVDDQNGCRMWKSSSESVPFRLDIIEPNFNFRVPRQGKGR